MLDWKMGARDGRLIAPPAKASLLNVANGKTAGFCLIDWSVRITILIFPSLILITRLRPIGPLFGTQIKFEHFQTLGAGLTFYKSLINKLSLFIIRYQGYVCPGILVTLAREEEVACLQAAWASFSILCPQDLSILRSSANIYKHFD